MKDLLYTELFKIRKQKRTYFALAAVFVLEIFIMISAYFQGNGFLDMILDNLKDVFEFKGELLNGHLISYLILNSFWFHIPLILMIVVSGFLTSEYKDGTLDAIFLHPISKGKYILSKYLAGILFSVGVIGILIISTFVFSFIFFGRGDLVVFVDGLNFFESGDALNRLVLAYACGIIVMLFYVVVSQTFAVLFRESTMTWISSVFFLLLTTMLLKFDFNSEFLNEFFFPKLIDSWQLFFVNEIPYKEIFIKNIVLIMYTLIFGYLGMWIFQKRDIRS